jgi:large subunit ribosomal protein L24
MLTVKKKDKVVVLSGKDKGKQGEILVVDRTKGRVIVSKVNFVKRHTKATQQDPGGIREKEAPLPIAKVMLVCPKCNQPTRPKFDVLSDGKKVRICRKCGEMVL